MMRRGACALLATAIPLLSPHVVRADDKAACIDAHGAGQEQRLKSHWLDAEKSFKLCARSTCPSVIVTDCVRWYDELRAAIPGVIVAAKAPDGSDTMDASLIIDGARVADHLSAMSIEVDPGEHTIALEHSGWPSVAQKVVLREGEKERRVILSFAADGSEPMPAAVPSGRPSPLLGILLVSTGVVAAAVSIPLGVVGKVQEDDLASQPCGRAGTCSRGDVDAIARDYWIAGIVGGLGAVALGLGIWQLVSRGQERPAVALSASGIRFAF
jgi:hypothetical protein